MKNYLVPRAFMECLRCYTICNRPTQVKSIGKAVDVAPKIAVENNIRAMLLKGFEVPPTDDFLKSRKVLLANHRCTPGLAAPRKSMKDYFYKNADADEMIFIHKGKGVLHTFLGNYHLIMAIISLFHVE